MGNKYVYPSILELVEYIAMAIPGGNKMPIDELLKKRIPAEKAEELGLVPINICGFTKYMEEKDYVK